MQHIPLTLDSYLSAAVFRFRAICNIEIPFLCHINSCAAMNTGSLLLHMWIITNYPSIVESHEKFDDAVPYQPIILHYAIPASDTEKDTCKLSAVVSYKTRYNKSDGNMMNISFGLGEVIKVNTVAELRTFREMKLVLDINASCVASKVLGIYFDLCFQHAVTEFPEGVSFSKKTLYVHQEKLPHAYPYWYIVLHLILR